MSYDMRQSVADMRRAINYIRTTNMARDEAHQVCFSLPLWLLACRLLIRVRYWWRHP